MDQAQLETESKAIFSQVEAVEHPPFLSGRVLARASEKSRTHKEIFVWRWVASLSFFALVGGVTFTLFQSPKEDVLYAYKPYVIHVDLNEMDLKLAESAEIELPEGVTFVSKNEEVRLLRRLRLPVSQASEGRSRLPFVVESAREGHLPLQVRIYGADDRLIETRTLTLHFAVEKKG